MAYRLALEDKVLVNIKGEFAGSSKGKKISVDFDLTMDRLGQEEINAAMADGGSINDFLLGHTHGWDRQRLVLQDDGSPAAFCEEAFRVMLQAAGLPAFIYRRYLVEVGAQEKNSR
ncbi:MAG TPA: hypothetical protein VGE22_12345 [Solimonas sp.]